MKLALVHDYLIQDGGAEKVLGVLQEIWPDAPIFTLFFDPKKFPHLQGRDIRTSFLQRFPLSKTKYQWYIALMPTATERLDLRDFDVVVSSASAFAKGIITRHDTLHICYCHTPTRYLWSDTHSYIEELRAPRFVKSLLPPLLSYLRMWDKQAAERVDLFVANSRTVRDRIKKYYRKESHVIHPPVDIDRFAISQKPKTYFLTGGRLVAYKRFDLVVEACNRLGVPLKIFGSGPVETTLRERSKGNIEWLGRVDVETQAKLYADALAFIHPQEEDFGITPVESMASGRPVITTKGGGLKPLSMVTGEFLMNRLEDLADHLVRFSAESYDAKRIRTHAEQFSKEAFKEKLKTFVETTYARPG